MSFSSCSQIAFLHAFETFLGQGLTYEQFDLNSRRISHLGIPGKRLLVNKLYTFQCWTWKMFQLLNTCFERFLLHSINFFVVFKSPSESSSGALNNFMNFPSKQKARLCLPGVEASNTRSEKMSQRFLCTTRDEL